MIDFSKIKSKKEVGKCFDYAILPKQTTEQTLSVTAVKKAIKYNCKAFCFSLLDSNCSRRIKGNGYPGWRKQMDSIWTADKCSKSI